MDFRATERESGGVSVVELSGRITSAEGAALREFLRDLVGQGKTKILLSLKDIRYIDSSGIGELVASYVAVKHKGGDLKLLHLTPRVEQILVITKLAFILEDFNDELAAIRSFLPCAKAEG